MVIVNSDAGWRTKLIGSETASAPSGMLMEGLPLKVSVWKVSGCIALTPAEPLAGRATVTAVIGRSTGLKTLEMRTRI